MGCGRGARLQRAMPAWHVANVPHGRSVHGHLEDAMDRSNHYEAAFEAYLQWHRYCYVAVDETRRAMLGETRVKSLDFIVYGERCSRLLVDVKGRRYPGGKEGRWRRVWESWSDREDIDGLTRW